MYFLQFEVLQVSKKLNLFVKQIQQALKLCTYLLFIYIYALSCKTLLRVQAAFLLSKLVLLKID